MAGSYERKTVTIDYTLHYTKPKVAASDVSSQVNGSQTFDLLRQGQGSAELVPASGRSGSSRLENYFDIQQVVKSGFTRKYSAVAGRWSVSQSVSQSGDPTV